MKAKLRLRLLLIALAFGSGIYSALAQPVLNIAPGPQQSVLYWSTTPTNYLLQSAGNLLSPIWVTAGDAAPVSAVTVSNASPARFFRLFYTNPPEGMAMVPGGWFTMGDTLDGESDATPTNIFVSPFYMDVNLVSYSLWQAVYSYAITNGYSFVNAGEGKGTNYPVEYVDWFDCVKWCNARSEADGLRPVYYTDAGLTQIYKTYEIATPYVDWTANGYRLPTEAEWEKAARGGLYGRRFPWGNLISEYQANYWGDTNDYSYDFGPNEYNPIGSIGGTAPPTSPVRSFDLNGYGLYDMAGNVFEWCWDAYGRPYGQPTPLNPTGPTIPQLLPAARVMRGGCWELNPYNARCAFRVNYAQSFANSIAGFRTARTP